MLFKRDNNGLEVYLEKRRTRALVGTLRRMNEADDYVFQYDDTYRRSRLAIPLGPNLPLLRGRHTSNGRLFPEFYDRIPSKENPAYPDYCKAFGISEFEKNPIVLLVTIGRKGPSSFVFEPVYDRDIPALLSHLKAILKDTGISQIDFANALGISSVTFVKIMTKKSQDQTTLNYIDVALSVPEAALFVLPRTTRKIHDSVRARLFEYFANQSKEGQFKAATLEENRKQKRRSQ